MDVQAFDQVIRVNPGCSFLSLGPEQWFGWRRFPLPHQHYALLAGVVQMVASK